MFYCFRFNVEQGDDNCSLRIESWFTPKTNEQVDYYRYVGKLLKSIRQTTFNTMDLVGCDDQYIINLDMRASGIRYGKPSYMSCDIMLFPKDDKTEIDSDIYLNLMHDLLNSDKYLKFYKTKKDVV
jgi:hypothetical protein